MPATRRRPLHIGLGLVLLTLVTFVPALDFGFVNYDDPVYVTNNPYVRAGLSAEGVLWALGARVSSNYHPATVLSHMLDCELFGLNPRGHHLTSLLIHLVNVLLVFEVLRRLTTATVEGIEGDETALWPSAFVAAVFAVHPLRVETVVWIADRKDLLSGFFWLLAVAAYLAYVRRPSLKRYLPLLLAASLGLLSKATAVTLPCVLLLLDLWPLGRVPRTSWLDAARALPRLTLEKLPLFGLSAGSGLLAVVAQSEAWMPVASLSFAHRAANAAVSYVSYIAKTFAPHDLAVFYPHVPIPWWKGVLAGAFVVAMTGLAVGLWRRLPFLTVGWLWFAGTLVPVIGLTQVGNQAMADRYTYVSGLGLAIAVAWGLGVAVDRRALPRRVLAAAAVAVVLVLPWRTRLQLAHWESSVTLFRHALDVTAPNVVAHLNLAEGLREAQRPDESLGHYRVALAMEPARTEAWAGLGSALMALGRGDEAAAAIEKGLALNPTDARLHHVLAVILDNAGRSEEAVRHLEKAVELQPDFLPAHMGLADLYGKRGEAARARKHLERAMELDPRLGRP